MSLGLQRLEFPFEDLPPTSREHQRRINPWVCALSKCHQRPNRVSFYAAHETIFFGTLQRDRHSPVTILDKKVSSIYGRLYPWQQFTEYQWLITRRWKPTTVLDYTGHRALSLPRSLLLDHAVGISLGNRDFVRLNFQKNAVRCSNSNGWMVCVLYTTDKRKLQDSWQSLLQIATACVVLSSHSAICSCLLAVSHLVLALCPWSPVRTADWQRQLPSYVIHAEALLSRL